MITARPMSSYAFEWRGGGGARKRRRSKRRGVAPESFGKSLFARPKSRRVSSLESRKNQHCRQDEHRDFKSFQTLILLKEIWGFFFFFYRKQPVNCWLRFGTLSFEWHAAFRATSVTGNTRNECKKRKC